MSPTLFLIAFNELLQNLADQGFDNLAFADDLVIEGDGFDRMSEAIKIVEDWTKKAKMMINKKKSGILLINKKKTMDKRR